MAMGPQREVGAAAETTVAATTVASASPAPIPAAGDQAVVDITDDDAPPPGWGQWGNRPASATEPAARVLVMREDDCVMPQCSAHDAEASSPRAVLPAPDVVVAPPVQEPGHAGVPPAHFDEAQAKQPLWQEFRDHDASINNTVNEALRVHGGPSWRIF
jgi:hypothetical protein